MIPRSGCHVKPSSKTGQEISDNGTKRDLLQMELCVTASTHIFLSSLSFFRLFL